MIAIWTIGFWFTQQSTIVRIIQQMPFGSARRKVPDQVQPDYTAIPNSKIDNWMNSVEAEETPP